MVDATRQLFHCFPTFKPTMRTLLWPVLTATVTLLAAALPLQANSTGISTYSGKSGPLVICNVCHSRGETPTVSFSGPSTLAPGDTGTFTLNVLSANPDVQTFSGIDVSAAASGSTVSAGTLTTISGQGTKTLNGEITHAAPRHNDNSGLVAWSFKWKAPNSAGNYILYGAGNSVNRDFGTDGDRAAAAVFFVNVGNVTPLPTFTAAPPPTATLPPTETASPTPSLTATETASRTPSRTSTTSPSQTASPSHSATRSASPSPTVSNTASPSVTASPTSAPSTTPTPPATPTTTMSSTPSSRPTETPTPLPSASPTQTPTVAPTATPSPTSAATSTPSATATISVTPTASATATPAVPGDANCDVRFSAADLAAIVRSIGAAPLCGADLTSDGQVTADDALAMEARLYDDQ
jgi:hypothetical protein